MTTLLDRKRWTSQEGRCVMSELPTDHQDRMARARLSLDGLSVGDAFGELFIRTGDIPIRHHVGQQGIPKDSRGPNATTRNDGENIGFSEENRRKCVSGGAAPAQGRVTEWPNVPVLKTGVPARVPWVRIPPLPVEERGAPKGQAMGEERGAKRERRGAQRISRKTSCTESRIRHRKVKTRSDHGISSTWQERA